MSKSREGTKTIEEELWNIFTYYSMNGNPRDPVKLNSIAFTKFCKDIMVFDPTMTEKPLRLADVHLLFTAEIKKNQLISRSHQEGKDKLSYDEFLSCLSHLSLKCYPTSSSIPEEAMQRLLMDNILPLALRRKPITIDTLLHNPNIENIITYFQDSLKELYTYFATSTEKRAQVSNIIKTTSKHTMTFDEHKDDIEYLNNTILKGQKITQLSSSLANTSLCQMQYSDFIKFASDFGLIVSIGLSNLDIADIFLTVTALSDFSPELGRFDYKQFCEISPEHKLKAMFLSIWRHIHSTMQDQLTSYQATAGGFYTGHSGGFLRGAQMFNERFIASWSKDGYLDYLEGKVTVPPDQAVAGFSAMTNLLSQSVFDYTNTDSNGLRTPLRISTTSQLNPDSHKKKSIMSPKHKVIPQLQRSRKLDHTKSSIGNDNSTQVISSYTKENTSTSINDSVNRKKIIYDLHDNDDVGDNRITAKELRRLLKTRPDIGTMLYGFIQELGIEET